MGLGGVAIATLPSVIFPKLMFSDRLRGGILNCIEEDEEVYVLLSKPHSPNKLKFIGEVGVFMIRIP